MTRARSLLALSVVAFVVSVGTMVAPQEGRSAREATAVSKPPAADFVTGDEVYRELEYRIAPTSAHSALATEAFGGRREVSRMQPLTLDLPALRARLGDIKDIQVWRGNEPVTDVAPAEQMVALRRGEILAVQRDEPPAVAVLEEGGTVASSSTVLYTRDAAGRTRELGLVHRSAGLHWRPDAARFAGQLLVGLLDRENQRASEALDVPIPVQLLAATGALDRTQLEIDRIGLPYQIVAVDVEGPEDPFRVQLVSQVDPDLPPAELAVNRPRVTITAPAELQGFGVEDAEVTVSAVGARLRPGQAIILDLDHGWLAERTLVAGDRGTASTRIRSTGLGAATLQLAPGLYQADPKTIAFTTPWRFIVATLLGGALGATVLVYRLRRQAPRSRRRYVMDWIVGVIIGFGATTMAYAGIRLPELIPVPEVLAGELVPFALSFLCAALGSALMDAISGGMPRPVAAEGSGGGGRRRGAAGAGRGAPDRRGR